jgi:hypothetical protein
MKWSNAIVMDHEKQVQEHGKESSLNVTYDMNINNIGAYGLFLFEHRVYPTRLKMFPRRDENQENFYQQLYLRTIIRDWGLRPKLLESVAGISTKYNIVEKYLDIFEPAHLKALLIYLRIIIWGQSPFDKNQPKPTIQHKD